jgi:3',5'-cyclic-AMP phosphodiesterase
MTVMMTRRNFFEITGKALIALSVNPFQHVTYNHNQKGRSKINFRFAIASDGHFGQSETPFVEYHNQMLRWLTDEHEKSGLDFVCFNGDMIHDDTSFYPELKKILDTLPVKYHVNRGNHDKCSSTVWEKTWNSTLNFSFEHRNKAFIFLDTSNEKGDYLCPDIDWTKSELDKYKSKESIFVFMHITPVPWTRHSIKCKELVSLFSQQTNLKAVFHGHDHDEDNVKFYNGKPYFFDGHFGGNWGTNYRGYRIVEINNDRVITYQVNAESKTTANSVELRAEF